MKCCLFLVAVLVVITGVWGLTTHNHTTRQMADRTQSVNAIIDEAAR